MARAEAAEAWPVSDWDTIHDHHEWEMLHEEHATAKSAADIDAMREFVSRLEDVARSLGDVARELRGPRVVRVTKRSRDGAISEAVSEARNGGR